MPDLQSGGCRFESRPGLLRTKVYSAFHPSGVGKWVPAAAGKTKAGMAHSDCGWTCGCAGKTEIPWEHAPYLSASVVVFHYEKALYQVYAVCTFTFTFTFTRTTADDLDEYRAEWPRLPRAVMDWRSRPGPEPTTLEAVGDHWRYALVVVQPGDDDNVIIIYHHHHEWWWWDHSQW